MKRLPVLLFLMAVILGMTGCSLNTNPDQVGL